MLCRDGAKLSDQMNVLLLDFQEGACPYLDQVLLKKSELPHSIPSGTEARVRAISPMELQFHELILIWKEDHYQVRRFIRTSGRGALVGGDQFNPLATEHFEGPIFQVSYLLRYGHRLEVNNKAGWKDYLELFKTYLR